MRKWSWRARARSLARARWRRELVREKRQGSLRIRRKL
ncbi:hypothetical protein A2U01_0018203, partial [Trifolium medium]|nr:hypothetical protein [Trifolium medium]